MVFLLRLHIVLLFFFSKAGFKEVDSVQIRVWFKNRSTLARKAVFSQKPTNLPKLPAQVDWCSFLNYFWHALSFQRTVFVHFVDFYGWLLLFLFMWPLPPSPVLNCTGFGFIMCVIVCVRMNACESYFFVPQNTVSNHGKQQSFFFFNLSWIEFGNRANGATDVRGEK